MLSHHPILDKKIKCSLPRPLAEHLRKAGLVEYAPHAGGQTLNIAGWEF
jgi:hypothetical protein